MWVIPFILIPIIGLADGTSNFLKHLRRTTREISIDKFTELCSNIGCRPPGGQCDRNAFTQKGRIVCTCNKNYTGDLCQHRCSIDCGDHGRCVFVGETEKCVCLNGYHGENCNEKAISSLTTKQMTTITKSSLSSTGADMECSPNINFPCNKNNGHCVKNIRVTESGVGLVYRCICKEGWIGDFCDTPCNKKCKNGGICHVMNSGARKGEEVCLCNWSTTGEFCEIPKPFMNFITQRKMAGKRSHVNDVIKSKSSSDPKNITEKMSKNHISKRSVRRSICKMFCGSNSEKCTTRELPNHQVFFSCGCKKGWTGPLCQEKCSLHCENGGKCFFDRRHRQEFCIDCNEGYTGYLCENKIERTFPKYRF